MLKWYENLKVRHETENIRAVAEMMMEGKCPTENIRAVAEMMMEGKCPTENIRAVAEMMREAPLEEEIVCDGRKLSEETRNPERSGRNRRLSGVNHH